MMIDIMSKSRLIPCTFNPQPAVLSVYITHLVTECLCNLRPNTITQPRHPGL